MLRELLCKVGVSEFASLGSAGTIGVDQDCCRVFQCYKPGCRSEGINVRCSLVKRWGSNVRKLSKLLDQGSLKLL